MSMDLVKSWSDAKYATFLECGGAGSYNPICFNYWVDDAGKFRHDDYTNDDEYGDSCAGPANQACPICKRGFNG